MVAARARGFATYAAIRQLGRQGIAEMIARCCRHAACPGDAHWRAWNKMVWEPQINQGLVRFLDPRPGAVTADHDRRTDAVIAEILKTGEAFFGGVTWRGKRCMRISVCGWQTDHMDVNRALSAVERVLIGFR